MRRLLFAALGAAFAVPAMSQIHASGFINWTPNGGLYDYDISLFNDGTTPIDVLWYSWIPGHDFMAAVPTNVLAPAGWTGSVQGGLPGDGYSVEYTTASPLAAGSSLNGFRFTSSNTPAQLSGNSSFFPFLPIGTSFIYQGPAELSPGYQFEMNPVPEPAVWMALCPASLLVLRKRRP